MKLPKADARKVAELVAMNLRQTLPKRAANFRWIVGPQKQNEEGLEVTVYIYSKSRLAELIDHAERVGHVVERVIIRGARHVPAFYERRSRGLRLNHMWLIAAFAAAGLVATAILEPRLAQLSTVEDEIAELRQDQSENLTSLETLSANATNISGRADRIYSNLAMLSATRGQTSILNDLAVTLPDSVYLTEFTISGRIAALDARGTGDLRALLQSLQKLPWAERAELDGQVGRIGPSGEQLFRIVIQLRPDPVVSAR